LKEKEKEKKNKCSRKGAEERGMGKRGGDLL
jgi:hypothetical protein